MTVTLRPAEAIDTTHGALGIASNTASLARSLHDARRSTALATGVARTDDALALILDGLGQIANSIATKPDRSAAGAGPVGIAVQVGDVFWQAGPLATLYLVGILSANLALVNILPFPPLDGGRMLMLLIKSVARDAAQPPGRAADLPRRLRVPVRVPDLDHVLRHRPLGSGVQ